MTTTSVSSDPVNSAATCAPDVEVTVPVFNEQRALDRNIRRLNSYLAHSFPFTYRITIANNASTDSTRAISRSLEKELPHVSAVQLPTKGRGQALNWVWSHSDAAVVSYMDIDLSTDLSAFLPLIAPIITGHSDIAIGSRLTHSARVVRGPKRETISRCYNFLLRASLGTRFSDAQCGFKAIRTDRARELLPFIQDSQWFFDTELLVLAERAGMRIHEVPVDWIDDPDSSVDLWSTAVADLRGIVRMIRQGPADFLPTTTAIGVPTQPLHSANQSRPLEQRTTTL